MATLYADATGRIVFHAGLEGSVPIAPPAGVVATKEFDPETNAVLARAIVEETQRFRLLAGVLTRDGITVPITAPGQFAADRQQIEQATAQLDTWIAALAGGATLNAAQTQQAILFLLRATRFLLRRVAGS